jgi:hypothetical protein
VSVARQLTAQQRMAAAVAPLIKADGGHVAVAVDDLTRGTEASYHGTSEFVTASIVKVDILATTMIENSNNDSAIGEIDDRGHRMLVTVLSDDNSSEAFGISAIQAVAQQAVSALAYG